MIRWRFVWFRQRVGLGCYRDDLINCVKKRKKKTLLNPTLLSGRLNGPLTICRVRRLDCTAADVQWQHIF